MTTWHPRPGRPGRPGPGGCVAPIAAFVLAVAFFVADSIPELPGGELVALAIGLITFGWIAGHILQLTEPATATHPASEFTFVAERTP
jgi:hypothetical protein